MRTFNLSLAFAALQIVSAMELDVDVDEDTVVATGAFMAGGLTVGLTSYGICALVAGILSLIFGTVVADKVTGGNVSGVNSDDGSGWFSTINNILNAKEEFDEQKKAFIDDGKQAYADGKEAYADGKEAATDMLVDGVEHGKEAYTDGKETATDMAVDSMDKAGHVADNIGAAGASLNSEEAGTRAAEVVADVAPEVNVGEVKENFGQVSDAMPDNVTDTVPANVTDVVPISKSPAKFDYDLSYVNVTTTIWKN